jgi:hypothetical protein
MSVHGTTWRIAAHCAAESALPADCAAFAALLNKVTETPLASASHNSIGAGLI